MDGNRYGEVDKSLVTKQDAALFNVDEAQIVQIIKSYTGAETADVTRETKLTDIRDCDSLDVVQIVIDCEDRFDIDIPDDDAESIVTVGDLFAIVAKHRK
jgi:acyl carrier protein